MRSFQIQTNFTCGEITPVLWGHVDIAKYKNALKTAENCTILPHGPVRRRNGFKYIAEVKDSSAQVRLLRFQFDQDNAYILEFGNNYIRFFKDGAQVLSGGNPYEVVTTYTTAQLYEITYVQFGRIIYLFHSSHAPAQLTWTNDTSWALEDTSFYPITTDESGSKPTTTLTPSAVSGTGVNFTAGANTFQPSDVGRQLKNLVGNGIAVITGYTSVTVVVCDILENFPNTSAISSQNWLLDLSPIVSITPSSSRIGSSSTVTSAAAAFKTGNSDEFIGKYIVVHNGIMKISAVATSTSLTAQIQKGLDAVSATAAWTLENPAWTSTLGYPSVCALHQQRLWAGSTTTYPQRVWASESGIFDSMGIGADSSDALDFDVSNQQVSKITWMANIRGQLVIGTTGSELTIDSGSTTGPITPSSLVQQVRGYNGANLQQAIGLDDQVLYVQRSGRKINAFRYDFQIDNYVSQDLLFLAEHLVDQDGIKEICYAQDPDRNLYAVLNNGELLSCTYIREQEVIAWTKYITDGLFESINTISTGPNDELWVVVKRTINGSTKRYIERLDISTGEERVDGFSDSYLVYSNPKTIASISLANPGVVTANSHGYSNGDLVKIIDTVATDSDGESIAWEGEGVTYKVANKTANTFELTTEAGANVNTTSYSTFVSGNVHKLVSIISGLSHLEGSEVQIKADGASHNNKTVSGGSITLDAASYEATIGLPYTTTIVTLPKEYSLTEGSQQGQQSRWVRPILRLYKSCLPLLNGEMFPARSPVDLMDSAVPLYTGDLICSNLRWTTGFASNLTITVDQPLPFVLLGIFGSIDSGAQ
jgi:hypothetical protein